MANISKVYLLNVPLEDDMKNTLYFANSSAQKSYMDNNVIRTYLDVSYQRDTSTFRCPTHIDSIRNCNYMMYQNTAYTNKWFYCFIKKMTYVNDQFTDVEFEVDPIQTFMFDITVRPSFVEREHTNDDTMGNNTIPENLELGDYIEANAEPVKAFNYDPANTMWVLGVNRVDKQFTDESDNNFVTITSIPCGLTYIGVDSMSDLKKIIKLYVSYGHSDWIDTIFTTPKACWQNSTTHDYNTAGIDEAPELLTIKMYTTFTTKFTTDTTITNVASLGNGYQPRNAKLLTFPYRYLQMSNGAGSVANYHYEYFKNPLDGTIGNYLHFTCNGEAGVGCDIKVFPNNYKNITNNYDEGLVYAKLPVGSWTSDAYVNWLTQNSVNIATGFVSDIASIAIGAGTAPAGGAVGALNGISGIANKVGQIYEHSRQPNQLEGSVNVGNTGYSWGLNGMFFKYMTIKDEMARIADDFFDMFGYATHRVKVPYSAHRQNWWYTKTIDCNITGDVPNDYMNQIKDAYNNGITFWRNPSNFLNYSVSNGIV